MNDQSRSARDQQTPGGCCCGSPLPEVTFSTFIISLASAALVGLGEVPDPATGRVQRDLLLARHNIDILEMLRQKTEGGLDAQERGLLENVLCELRLKYVIGCDAEKAARTGAEQAAGRGC